jgi:hypothetical protein
MTSIAVVIPAWNAGAFLERAIASAIAQTASPAEIIVVDDGSTDDTAERASRFRTAVTLIQQENKGLSAARNAGIRAAKSDYVAFLDADDWWESEHLENTLAAIARGARWTASAWMRTDGHYRRTVKPFPTDGPREYLRVAAYRNVMIPSGVAVLRRLLLDAGGFPEAIRRHAEDKIMWAKLAALCPEPFFIAEATLNYYQHAGSITKARIAPQERIATGLSRAATLLDILDANPSPAARRMARGTALRSAQSLMRLGARIPEEPFRRVLAPLPSFFTRILLLASRFRLARILLSRSINITLIIIK